MEGLMTQKVTPLLKCIVLFLFIFTAKVLTSRPQESQEARNGIHQIKPSHYVRTFTKYHHRRTIQRNNQDWNNYWPVESKNYGKRSIDYPGIDYDWPISEYTDNSPMNTDISTIEPKIIKKRSPDYSTFITYWQLYKRSIDSSEFISENDDSNLKPFTSDIVKNVFESEEKSSTTISKENRVRNRLSDINKYKVKAAMIVTTSSTTMGPTISCLYKIHNVAMSVTPAYDDERNAQLVVENDSFDTGPISEMILENGDVVQYEQCTDTRASCYTLWHQHSEGNITVLGQGCWRASQTKGRNTCDKCTRVTARLPGTKFCCCTKSNCNADFTSLQEEILTVKAESTMNTASQRPGYSNILASAVLALVAILVMAVVVKKFYCRVVTVDKEDLSDGTDVEKGDIMGSGPDALATGLLCVDNLTLIEHIGQGKFGSVWRGSLGANAVAVKLYSSANTWQKEASIYSLPHLAHPNILRYYGSETRARLTEGGGREHLVVVELCAGTLRDRLRSAPLSWLQFASLARGLAAALAHLHAQVGNKPCVVHRDVNSNNVLIATNGEARLADLGLAQPLLPRREHTPPSRITEAGTLRYLAPEALEGALDLSGARAALCAVDVFALGLVLWEMLWRTRGAHNQPVPPYALPYHHHGLPLKPTLAQMQSLVSRNKARPPLPTGPDSRMHKIATDTCDECWDHDAEARLTAVCVEERMAELKQMLQAQTPLIHDNNLHPHTNSSGEGNLSSPQESDKNSNCTVQNVCDVTTPLLYPQPHIGRNACIERNTNTQQHTVELIHKSLKDITAPTDAARVQNMEEHCLSVARIPNRPQLLENSLNEIRSYQRPLDYVQNDVSRLDIDRGPKQTNLFQDMKASKPKWGIKRFFEKFQKKSMDVEVKLVPENVTKVALVSEPSVVVNRPSNLILSQNDFNLEGPLLSPPNKTLPVSMMDQNNICFKELPRDSEAKTPNQIFAVIVPKAKPTPESSESLNKHRASMSSQSNFKSNSVSDDSTVKKRLSCDKVITNSNSRDSSINLELQYMDNQETYNQVSPFELNSDCSSSEDEHLMLLSENGGSKITMQTVTKPDYQNEVLKESTQTKTVVFNKAQNKYSNFDNEYSDPNDKENLVNGYSGDNPVYLLTAALNGDLDTAIEDKSHKSSKVQMKSLSIKRQHSLEQVSEIFSSGDVHLLNPAGRVKTPGDLPAAVRRARRDRVLQKGKTSECNRLSLYDDRMMFGNSL